MAEIFATEYNSLRSRINAVMVTDYGQSLNAVSNVTGDYNINSVNTDKVAANQWNNLYIDMIRARVHQTSSFTQQPLWVGNYNVNTTNTDKVTQVDLTYLSALMTDIETNNRALDVANQATILTIESSSTNTAWNSILTHEFNINFASVDARQYFFKAGGQIRFNAGITYTGSESKTLDWQNLLNGIGNIIMNYDETTSSNFVGTGSPVGGLDLTTTNTQIYQRFASTYTTNNYRILARLESTSSIRIRIEFVDANTQALTAINRNDGFPDIDETVKGTTFSNCVAVIPDGQVTIGGTVYDTVVLPSPTTTVVSEL